MAEHRCDRYSAAGAAWDGVTFCRKAGAQMAIAVVRVSDERLRLLRSVEWSGYDAAAGERACPNCEAWRFQPSRPDPIHAFACSLAHAVGAPMEDPERGVFWSGDRAPP